MNTWIKEIDSGKRKKALEMMSKNRLVFLLNNPESIKKLTQYVEKKNKVLYGEEVFKFIITPYEKDLIVAAVPDLGPGQLGVFAGRNFETGEIVATYVGKDLWGELPLKVMKKKIAQCDDSGDYFWEVASKNGYSRAIDSKFEGSAARFVNDSLQRNVDIENINGVLCYKAKKPIKFSEEITANYGDTYFSKKHPRIEYTPTSLQSILGIMLQNSSDLSSLRFENIDSIQNFLEAMNWNNSDISKNNNNNNNDEPFEALLEKKLPHIPEARTTSDQKLLYINSNNDPLIFDLSNEESFLSLSKTTATQINKTSDFKLFVAPVGFSHQKRKFSLFSGQKITKKSTVCIIEGEQFNKKQFKEKEKKEIIDESVLFDVAENKKIYCKNIGSEALFVQAANNPQSSNVMLSISKGAAKYIATKDIEPGCEIMTHFHNYPYSSPPTTLQKVVDAFNANQLKWDALLTEELNESYTLRMSPHCMTPGREVEDSNDYFWFKETSLKDGKSESLDTYLNAYQTAADSFSPIPDLNIDCKVEDEAPIAIPDQNDKAKNDCKVENETNALEMIAMLKELELDWMIPFWTQNLSSSTLSKIQKHEDIHSGYSSEAEFKTTILTQRVNSSISELSQQQNEFPNLSQRSELPFLKKELVSPLPSSRLSSSPLSPISPSLPDEDVPPSLSPITNMQHMTDDASPEQDEYFTLTLSPQPEIMMMQLQQREYQSFIPTPDTYTTPAISEFKQQSNQNRVLQNPVTTPQIKSECDSTQAQPRGKRLRDTSPTRPPKFLSSFQKPAYINEYGSLFPKLEDHTKSEKKTKHANNSHLLTGIDQNFFNSSRGNWDNSSIFFSTSSQPSSVNQNTTVRNTTAKMNARD